MKWSELNWTELRIFLSPISLKLCTPTGHDELIFLNLRISVKQICCGFTECRLAHGVPTCPAAKPKQREVAMLHRKWVKVSEEFFCLWFRRSEVKSEVVKWSEAKKFLQICTPTSHDKLLLLYLRISAKQICCGFTECLLARGDPTCPAAKRSDLPLLHRDHLEEWEPTPHRSKWFSLPFPLVSVIVLVFSLNINSNYDRKCRFMFPLPLPYIFRFLFFSFEYFYNMIAEADLCWQTNRNLTSRILVFWLFFFNYIIKLRLTVDLWWLVKKKSLLLVSVDANSWFFYFKYL